MDELWHSIPVYFLLLLRVIDSQCLYRGSHYSLQPGLLVVRYDFMWSFHEYIICQVLVITVYMDVLNNYYQADDIRNEANELLRIRDYLFNELASKTGQPVEKVSLFNKKSKFGFRVDYRDKLEHFQVHLFFYLGHCLIVHWVSEFTLHVSVYYIVFFILQINKDLKRMKRFNAQEALEYGLIDRVVRPPRIKADAPPKDAGTGLG